MTHSPTCPQVNGAIELESWLGGWPTFHDAEVIEIRLSAEGASEIRVRTWRPSNNVNPTGHFNREKRVIVSFELTGIFGMELFDFGHQNVLSGAFVTPVGGGHRIDLEQLHGLGGWILASEVSVSFTPETE